MSLHVGLDGLPLVEHLVVAALTLVQDIRLTVGSRELSQAGLVITLDMLLESAEAAAAECANVAGEGIGIKPLLLKRTTCLVTPCTSFFRALLIIFD